MEPKPTIPLKAVLAAMAVAVEPFDLRYVKLNEQKGTGGELVALSGQLLSGKGAGQQQAPAQPTAPAEESAPAAGRRDPQHHANMTRNLRSTVNGRYTKVHIYLITEFNGKKVII